MSLDEEQRDYLRKQVDLVKPICDCDQDHVRWLTGCMVNGVIEEISGSLCVQGVFQAMLSAVVYLTSPDKGRYDADDKIDIRHVATQLQEVCIPDLIEKLRQNVARTMQ